jgi:16S rRNA (uracil1498-N3)-methyltransferase
MNRINWKTDLYYAEPDAIDRSQARITLDGDEFRHVATVMRKKTGDRIFITDGLGTCYETEIVGIEKKMLTANIITSETESETETYLAVAQSLTKNPDRFDWFVEKATELGVTHILPMITDYTVSKPKDRQSKEAKAERWKKIIVASCKQCKRFRFPVLDLATNFDSVIANAKIYQTKLIPYENADHASQPVRDYARMFTDKRTLVLIGPEGGFSEVEVAKAKMAGFEELSLGKTILRSETAGVMACAFVKATELMTSGEMQTK